MDHCNFVLIFIQSNLKRKENEKTNSYACDCGIYYMLIRPGSDGR